MTVRKCVFWIHLAVGLAAGIVIAIMCVTGAALAFEKQIVAWAERDARQIPSPAPGAARLTVEDLLAAFTRARPDTKPQSITIDREPDAAIVFSLGRGENAYVNPYDGTIHEPASHAARDLMRRLTEWHRWFALSGQSRATARLVTGAANAGFLFLTLSGAILWWPRKWRTKGLRRSLWFLRRASGRAREWNWHNVVGFWLLPVLIALSASGVVLSYRSVNDWIFHLAGDNPPGPGLAPAPSSPPWLAPPSSDARPLGPDALLEAAQREFPQWQTITLFLNPRSTSGGERLRPPVFFTVTSTDAWPRVATTGVTLDPFTGAVRRVDAFRDLSPGRRVRTWVRFLHTGEALGLPGQWIAGLGCVGGCLLVYTGFALAWRRFRGEKKLPPATEPNGVG
ncbi:MAG TPA: PepSY-associated TM helix domain-containing protein [Lacunisphaera sp.]|nr:PepSY-associated TM helix domain-containing protein [Lacunisphaera sp.]